MFHNNFQANFSNPTRNILIKSWTGFNRNAVS